MRNIGLLLGNRAAPARAAATITILLGLASVVGWVLGIQPLTSIIPGSPEMKLNTAVGFVLCGASLLILADRPSTKLQCTAQIASAGVFLLGLATIAEYYLGRSFGIDELLGKDPAGAFNVFRGRMSPATASAFIATGLALVALSHRRLRVVAILGAGGAILIGCISLLGYLWSAAEIITDRWIPPVALNTGGCFALLGGGILLTPQKESTDLDKQIAALAAVEIKILAGFIISLSLLLIGGSYTYRTSVRFADSAEWIAHIQEVRGSWQSVYGSLAGAEVALRDYLLTRNDENLAEYETLSREIHNHLERTRSLTQDNPVLQENVLLLRPILSGRLAAMASTLTAYRDFGLPAARAVIAVTRNLQSTQDVRAQIARLDREEGRLLEQREEATARVRGTILISLLATLSMASVLFVALFRGIRHEMLARRDAEDAVRASARYTRSILDSSPDCLGVLSLEGRLTQMTPQGLRLMDIDDFAVVENADWVKIWKGADRDAAKAALDSARRGIDRRFQGFCPTVKGTPKWWDVIVMPINGASGKPERLLAVSRDISDARCKRNELRETNHFLDSLFEALPLMVYVKDARTLRYIRINRECERITGFKRRATIELTARDILPPAEAAAIEITDLETLTSGRLTEIQEEVVSTADRGPRSRHTMKMPIFDDSGAAQYLLGISEDVTERKLAEKAIQELNSALEAKARQLEISNKELESFSYSISHDLRAPLRAIDGFALMIEEDYREKLDTEGRRYVAVIRENSKRMGALIDDLLEFSRLGRLPVVSHDINVEQLVHEVVQEVLHEHGRHAAGGAAPHVEIGQLPPARGDRGLLRQVWTNLIANAIKYSSKKTHPRIEVSGGQTAAETHYSVRDNGVGFDMDYAGKLFGVFQRLHRADEFSGTGVGLAIVHRVVSRHGGRVWAEGKLGDGAVFSFALPRGGTDG